MKEVRLVDANKLMQMIPAEEYNARMVIANAPIIEAEPVRHGHWTNIKISVTGNSSAECSLCGTVVHDTFADVDRLNYCPHCGAKMDPVEEYAYVDPDIYPCRICEDYDGKGGCMSKGGCGQRREDAKMDY